MFIYTLFLLHINIIVDKIRVNIYIFHKLLTFIFITCYITTIGGSIMDLDISDSSVPVFRALASNVRVKIIQLLSKDKLNVAQLSKELGISSTITINHLNKLEAAHLISSEKIGNQRVSTLTIDTININFPTKLYTPFKSAVIDIPIGQYTAYNVHPTCGLADSKGFIGKLDQPGYFMDPKRYQAGMLWFGKGYVEYQIPNYLQSNQTLEMLELSLELSSEFPFSNNNWESDITISIDGHDIGTWTSPGDFSDTRGRYTPKWLDDDLNQYGILKSLRISNHGSTIDGKLSADTTIDMLDTTKSSWTLRIAVKDDASNVGGCTIFGHKFGNHDQGIKTTLYYSDQA